MLWDSGTWVAGECCHLHLDQYEMSSLPEVRGVLQASVTAVKYSEGV